MHNYLKQHALLSATLVIITVFSIATFAQSTIAATTISTNISTGGTLSVTGASALMGNVGIGTTVFGPELVTNGGFNTNLSGWAGTGWSWSDGTALHTGGQSAALVQSTLSAIVGHTYKVSYTVSEKTLGLGVELVFGGIHHQDVDNGVFTDYFTAVNTDPLTITVLDIDNSFSFNGKIDDISIMDITTAGSLSVAGIADFYSPVTVHSNISFPFSVPVRIGYNAGTVNAVGTYYAGNTFIGHNAGASNTTGLVTAIGQDTAISNTTGTAIAIGHDAASSNTTGNIVAIGRSAGLYSNAIGTTAIGYQGAMNSTGIETALGYQALTTNTTGGENTALGYRSLFLSTIGNYNTSVGHSSLYRNTSGGYNTAIGHSALLYNTTSNFNTAIGWSALYSTTGASNIGIGREAGNLNTTGTFNTFIGNSTGLASSTQHSYLTVIGAGATGDRDNSIILGRSTDFVGIGTTSPATALDVNGIIKTQPASSRTCDALAKGGIMYDSDDNHFYGCNGTVWVQLDN